jgi:hypothetical protein
MEGMVAVGGRDQRGTSPKPEAPKWASKANASRNPARRMTSKLTQSTRLNCSLAARRTAAAAFTPRLGGQDECVRVRAP